jgi:ATP-dependent Lon protease
MFIATANTLETIHPALLDRMEIIEISGYTFKEKVEIAKTYLIPRQISENGLVSNIIQFPPEMIQIIISNYTAESGVRNLERAIGSVCRTVAFEYAVSKEPT